MIQISLPYIIECFLAVDRLSQVSQSSTIQDLFGHLWIAKDKLDEVYARSLYAPALRSSRESAGALSKTLENLLNSAPTTRKITPIEEWTVRNQREQLRTELLAELRIMPSFFVTQKGGFDTLMLLDQGSSLMPRDLLAKVPETLPDLDQMGKCLAYDLGTAAGFHIFRVLEAVLRRYYTVVSGGDAAPKVRTIGAYVRAMRKLGCGEESVLATLEQIRDLHRNPLVHPEATITADHALSLLGIVRSAVEAMLAELPETVPHSGLAAMFVDLAS